MVPNPQSPIPNPSSKNVSLALNLLMLALGMLALAFASVPLYRLFCQVTGYGGTTQAAAAAPPRVFDREIAIRFNADIAPGLSWEFKPGDQRITVKVGEQAVTHFTARNLTPRAVTGRAAYNVVPFSAGAYFSKIECFCFIEQTLTPGQEVKMPVVFYIDPSIMDDPEMRDIKTITLSYTFFPAPPPPRGLAPEKAKLR